MASSLITKRAVASAHLNSPRQVALFRSNDSQFADAIADFVHELGLGTTLIVAPDHLGSPNTINEVADAAEKCGAAIFALESKVIQDGFASAASGRTAQPTPGALSLLAYAMAGFPAKRLIIARQRDDPGHWDIPSVQTCNLGNDRASAKHLVQALQNANTAIASGRLKPEAKQFEFPAEWWQRDFGDDSKGRVPSFTEFLVDSMFNRSLTQTKLQDEVREKIQSREPLDLKYHYVGWRAARAWADLTRDTSYAHTPHIKRLVKCIPEILPSMDTASQYNYISLGPGIGDTDADILRALRGSLAIRSLFLVDVSIELLQLAADEIIKRVLEKQVLRPAPRVRAMLADFENNLKKLAPILNVPDVRNCFTLLGFTIGNGSEFAILSSLEEGTRPGDYVLFDARLHPYGTLTADFDLASDEREALVAPYNTDTLEAFAFAPVEEASDYIVRASEVNIDLVPNWSKRGHKFHSEVPSAINVYVECTGLYENALFMERMGISRASAEPSETLRLATLTFYDFKGLIEWLEQSGSFAVRWKRELEGAGVFLLERLG